MYLFVNTQNAERIFLALLNKNGKLLAKKNIQAKYQQSEKLLSAIDKLVPKMKDLKGVIVMIGPGSFTSLRIGVATANAMAWACQIPIVGVKSKSNDLNHDIMQKGIKLVRNKKKFKQVLPEYGKEPNITFQNTKLK